MFKFRFCLGRHIRVLCGFSGARATDRRLKALIDAEYLTRKKYLYGMPYLYTLTHKGRMIIGVNKRADVIRVDRITHDITVIDTVIYFVSMFKYSLKEIESEKELHIKSGFGKRKHQPDFIINTGNINNAVEIELSAKSKERLENNIKDNYMRFNTQMWVVGDNKIRSAIVSLQNDYPNLHLIPLERVTKYVKERCP